MFYNTKSNSVGTHGSLIPCFEAVDESVKQGWNHVSTENTNSY